MSIVSMRYAAERHHKTGLVWCQFEGVATRRRHMYAIDPRIMHCARHLLLFSLLFTQHRVEWIHVAPCDRAPLATSWPSSTCKNCYFHLAKCLIKKCDLLFAALSLAQTHARPSHTYTHTGHCRRSQSNQCYAFVIITRVLLNGIWNLLHENVDLFGCECARVCAVFLFAWQRWQHIWK